MSDHNWCHGSECHEQQTQSRIRGSGDNKVLRTRRIPLTSHYIRNSIWAYFCNQRCLMDFVSKHAQAIANIAPRREPLETPIKVEKEKYESYRYDWNSDDNGGTRRVPYMATRTTIKTKNSS